MDKENLGPAERIINAVLTYNDHCVHNRPGMVVPDASSTIGISWSPVTHKLEDDKKVVYKLVKQGKKSTRIRTGILHENGEIKSDAGQVIGRYREAGLFPEVVTWMYKQVADVWKLDNEFAARWASFAFGQEHRDLKVVLACFMLVQGRKGDPVTEKGEVAFYDEDYRDIGEAMMLVSQKDRDPKDKDKDKNSKDFNPKLLLRMYDILTLPDIAKINHELGFGKSARRPFLGRWDKAVEKYLRYREENPKMLEGLVKHGFRSTIIRLARRVGYKPTSDKFFQTLRWKQVQSEDGRRQIAIGQAVAAAESWDGLSETEICERITRDRPNYKRIVGLMGKSSMTRAIMASAIDAKALSNKDMIILTPTLEELGLLQVQEYKEKWEKAIRESDDMRAANIATRVKSKETQEKLVEAADTAIKKAVEEVTKDVRVYFFVDRSGSMTGAIVKAKENIAKFLQAFPPDRIHVAAFNTVGKEIEIKHASAAGVENAFRGIAATGGTSYGSGVVALQGHRPNPGEDVLFIFVGDEEENGTFDQYVRVSNLNPMAFGLLKVKGDQHGLGGMFNARLMDNYSVVRDTAARLGIPCFMIDEKTFEDVYAIPRTIRNLVSATPVNRKAAAPVATPRLSLVEQIMKTDLLKKPAWAAA